MQAEKKLPPGFIAVKVRCMGQLHRIAAHPEGRVAMLDHRSECVAVAEILDGIANSPRHSRCHEAIVALRPDLGKAARYFAGQRPQIPDELPRDWTQISSLRRAAVYSAYKSHLRVAVHVGPGFAAALNANRWLLDEQIILEWTGADTCIALRAVPATDHQLVAWPARVVDGRLVYTV